MIRSAWDRLAFEVDQMPEDAALPFGLLVVVVGLIALMVASWPGRGR